MRQPQDKDKNIDYHDKYLYYKELYLQLQKHLNHDPAAVAGGAGKQESQCQWISYFFDNDPDNFSDKHLCPCIIPVTVGESQPISTLEDGMDIYTNMDVIKGYCEGLSHGAKQYAEAMLLLGEAKSYDPASGISKEQLRYYTKLVKQPANKNIKAFIFDWDRTLTVLEGIYAIKPTVRQLLRELDLEQVDVMDVAEFYFGGLYRISRLQRLWNSLREKDIDIWVLSSNPAIGEVPLFFLNLLNSVGLEIRPDHLVYRDMLTKYQYMKKYIEKI